MRVLLCRQGEEAQLVEVRNTLKELQTIVDGFIEVVPFFRNSVLICNEEGKLREDLKPNRFLTVGRELDLIRGNFILIRGNFIICGANGEEFDDIPKLLEPLLYSVCKNPHFDKNGEPI